jgi:hypothetical protein
MLKVAAKSKKGNQLIQRNGDLWVPVQHQNRVSSLGGHSGIQLKSVRTGKTYWIRDEGDMTFWVIDKVNEKGQSTLPKHERARLSPDKPRPVPLINMPPEELAEIFDKKESKDAQGVLQAA